MLQSREPSPVSWFYCMNGAAYDMGLGGFLRFLRPVFVELELMDLMDYVCSSSTLLKIKG